VERLKPYAQGMVDSLKHVTKQHVGEAFFSRMPVAGNLHLFIRSALPILNVYGILTLLSRTSRSRRA